MPSRRIENDYEPLSTGSNTIQFQILTGFLELVVSPTQPPSSAVGFRMSPDNDIITITPPTQAWIRSNPGDYCDIVESEVPS